MAARLAAFLLAALFALPAYAAVDRAAVEVQFQNWIVATAWPEAKAAKVSRATFDRAFAGVTLDWTMPDLIPPGTEAKPPAVEWQNEFRSPGNYFGEKNLASLAAVGKARLEQWKDTLGGIEKQYGVPRAILLAIWAKETGYGAEALPRPAVRALATEAFMGRRADFFRAELIAALVILENGDIGVAGMRSSMAGALGQPQFMPSQFLKFAADGDGDGHRDIWKSVPDTLASIARYLAGNGWEGGRGWGLEAKVPAGVACSLEGPEQFKPMSAWAKLGITQVDGAPLPRGDRPVGLLMPAGRFGPAFIVTPNFYVLKRYNNSDLYGLYIGNLADRIAGVGAAFVAPWGRVGGFERGDVKAMQDALVRDGYDVGNADGLVGFKTRIAIGLWQAKHGEAETCFPDANHVKNIR
ncbi:MAG: lytic murein transglycosylase [Bauldia sp.]